MIARWWRPGWFLGRRRWQWCPYCGRGRAVHPPCVAWRANGARSVQDVTHVDASAHRNLELNDLGRVA